MTTRLFHPPQTEFNHRSPKNYLLVENRDDVRVVIRAPLDNYSEQRKALFIHELAAEGFIPAEYQFVTNTGDDWVRGVRWVIDNSCLVVPADVIATCHRRGWELFLSVFIVAVAIFDWLIIRITC